MDVIHTNRIQMRYTGRAQNRDLPIFKKKPAEPPRPVCRQNKTALGSVSPGGYMTGFDIFAIALVLLVIFTLFAGVNTVPQGFDWPIDRFGRFTRALSPGLHLIIAYFDRLGGKMN